MEKVAVIIFIFILILTILSFIYLWLIVGSNFTLSRRSNLLPCSECAVNINTGIKICSKQGETLLINPAEQVCSSQFLCDNPVLPYAILSDGSTNFSGVCENNIPCSCSNSQKCPSYISSAFITTNGDPYDQPEGQRMAFSQISGNGEIISFTNSTTFCQIPYSWLPYGICPNMTCFEGNDCPLGEQLQQCMTLPFITNPVVNPCYQGNLAVLSNEDFVPSLTDDYLSTASYGCIITEFSCPQNSITLYNTNIKNIFCLTKSSN